MSVSPTISAVYTDTTPGSGVDPLQTELWLNSGLVADTAYSDDATGLSYTPAADLTPGVYTFDLKIWDVAGNGPITASTTLTANDLPTVENLILTIVNPPPDEQLYLTGSNLYYGPAASGQVEVAVDAYDLYPGLTTLEFPAIFGGDGEILNLNGTTTVATYSHNYTVNASQAVNSSLTITATDGLGYQGQSAPFHVEQDVSPPGLIGPNLSVDVGLGDPDYVYLVTDEVPTLYYQTLATGDLTVSVVISDSQAGLNEVVFPDIFTANDGSTFDQTSSRGPVMVDSDLYAIVGSAALDGVFNVIVSDMVDNQTVSPNFAVIQDTVAPDVTFTMPDRVPLKIPISWQGLDEANVTGTPGAGIRHYDVEYKVGLAGTWTTLLAATPESAYPGDFVGMVGEEYYFRIQATDNVSNVSPWVEFGPVIVAPVTKYYLHGGAKVAMRQGDEVYYLHGDHLGSTSLTTDSDGAVTSEVRYHPYGQERWVNGVAVTDFGFTSQRTEKGFNLHDYNARYYSSYLNQFVSPDTIIPNSADPQSFNRYAYVRGNPLKYRDPTGHCFEPVSGVTCVAVGKLVVDVVAASIAIYFIADSVQELGENMESIPLNGADYIEPLPGYGEGELNRPDPAMLPPTTLLDPELTSLQTPPYGGNQPEQQSGIFDPFDSAGDLTLTVLEMASKFGFKDLDRHHEDHGQWYGWSPDEYHQAAENFILGALSGVPGYEIKQRGTDLLIRSGDWFAVLHAGKTIGTFFEDEDMDDYWEGQ